MRQITRIALSSSDKKVLYSLFFHSVPLSILIEYSYSLASNRVPTNDTQSMRRLVLKYFPLRMNSRSLLSLTKGHCKKAIPIIFTDRPIFNKFSVTSPVNGHGIL